MPISRIHSYLVHPGKNEANPTAIGGVEIPLSGKLFQMLGKIDNGARKECDIDIIFRANGKKQQNDCRDALLAYLKKPSMALGRNIAERLQRVTTKRSGLGLLFLIAGKDQHGVRLLISRFPAETGVTAQEHGKSIDVEFVEKVFMKNVRSYKCAFYQAGSVAAGFWDGFVVDRQMIDTRGAADYWTREFLDSDLRNTPAAGTQRLAIALRDALEATNDPMVRQELIAASQLLPSREGSITSAKEIVTDLALSPAASSAIQGAFPRRELFGSTFQFDRTEFDSCLLFRSIELDNGVMLTAENTRFDDVIHAEPTPRANKTLFTTEGNIVNERLRKTR